MVDPEYKTVFGHTGRLFGTLCVLGVIGLAVRTRRREDEVAEEARRREEDMAWEVENKPWWKFW